MSKLLAGLSGEEYKNSLLGEFYEDGCLDELRYLSTEFGARPYRVFLVRTRWTGPRRGTGAEVVVSEDEITPPPKVESMSGLQYTALNIGSDEGGAVQVSEISPRYTENELLGVSPDGSSIPQNETFYWEIRFVRGDAEDVKFRRFMVRGTPAYEPTKLQWRVSLTRAGNDRQGNGVPG